MYFQKNLINWKNQFLENAEIAMKPSKAVKEYKDQIKDLEKKVDKYAKTVGKITEHFAHITTIFMLKVHYLSL